jgi:hypothetical protein
VGSERYLNAHAACNPYATRPCVAMTVEGGLIQRHELRKSLHRRQVGGSLKFLGNPAILDRTQEVAGTSLVRSITQRPTKRDFLFSDSTADIFRNSALVKFWSSER